jgi:hypothetical protein
MKKFNQILAACLSLAVLFSSFVLPVAAQQDAKAALYRGYRTGYSDGYMAGYDDSVEKSNRGYEKRPAYLKADRGYVKELGALEDYRDVYQQGFAAGYKTGFERREFNSTVPTDIARRNQTLETSPIQNAQQQETASLKTNEETSSYQAIPATAAASDVPIIVIPANTEIIVELTSNVNTNESRRGDAFQARVVAPAEIEGAIVEGRVSDLQKPGRIKRRAELQLSFDRIVLNQARWANMNAMVVEALPEGETKTANNVKKVDTEGVVQGKSSLKTDVVTVGAATGAGATVGAIAGGPVGLAVGAAVGGAFGLGGVLVARGKDIKLDEGQRLRIRTAFETQIR